MSSEFIIVKPITVDDTNLLSSSLTENDYATWSGATTYAIGDRVIVIDNGSSPIEYVHKIYESLQGSNLNNYPPDSATQWVEVGPTNKWAVFDQSGGTKSTGTSPVFWTVDTGRIDSVAVLEMENVTSVQISAYSPSEPAPGIVYDQTFTIEDNAVVLDWYAYFFAEIDLKTELIVNDIPQYQDMQVTITLNGDSTISAGNIILGSATEIGTTSLGARSGIVDYSRKEVDAFGRATLVRRRFSKRMNVNILIDNASVDSIQYLLSDLRATPALWVAAKGTYELLTIFGFYRDFSIDIAYPNQSLCSLEIEGLT
jgi:hypothetical protein